MNAETFERLRGIIRRESGIVLADGKQTMLSGRLRKRIRAVGAASEDDYLRYLEQQIDNEIVHLLDAVSTNVTHFFREEAHFAFLRDSIQKWVAEGQSRFRIWCAASSTGEEPYSLAMTMLEIARGAGRPLDVKILATDISTRVLGQAIQGVYDTEMVSKIPGELRDRYFERRQDETGPVQVASRSLRDVLLFRRLNLARPPFPMRGPLDCVFCRNVMFYLDRDVRDRLVREIAKLLRPGGYLMLGMAENLQEATELFDRAAASVYRKRLGVAS